MEFYAVLDQVVELLRQRGRVTYRALKLQFSLDDNALETLKEEIIDAQRLAVDEQGKVLIWTGNSASATPPALGQDHERVPLAYTPPHLTDKILAARPALEASASRSPCSLPTSKTRPNSSGARSRSRPAAPRSRHPTHDGRRAPLRGHGESGARRWHYGPVWRPDCPRGPRPARLLCRPGHAGGHAAHPEEVRRTRGLELRMRVGLNSGEVVVRAIGNDLHMDYSAVGETTVLAARMEQIATPGSIRLTPSTLGLVEGLVQVNALGPVPVKGLPSPWRSLSWWGPVRCGGASRPPPPGG